jgi:hypothetical protein
MAEIDGSGLDGEIGVFAFSQIYAIIRSSDKTRIGVLCDKVRWILRSWAREGGPVMEEIKRPLSAIILPFVFGMLFLVIGIVEYLQFLSTWGFSPIDLIVIVAAIAMFLFFVRSFTIDTIKGWKSILFLVSEFALLAAWMLALFVILPQGTRLYELVHALWNLAFTGIFVGWLAQSRMQNRPTTPIANSREGIS